MLPSLPSGMQLGTNIRASDQAEHSPPPPPTSRQPREEPHAKYGWDRRKARAHEVDPRPPGHTRQLQPVPRDSS